VEITHATLDCASITDAQAKADTGLGTGGLFGTMTLINVNASAEAGYDAVALEAFRTVAPSLWNPPGSILPDLTQQLDATLPAGHQAETYQGGAVVLTPWNQGIDAVSAALMHDNVLNEYVLDSGTKSGTDWVVTYPTKRYYVAPGTGSPSTLFQRNFGVNGACDDVAIQHWDREEATPGGTPGGFSPPPPGSPNAALCWEANILTWNNSNILSSTNSVNRATTYQNGWARLNLVGPLALGNNVTHRLVSPGGNNGTVTFTGLPVVGFMVDTYYNGSIPLAGGGNIQSAYGASFKHKTTTCVSPPAASCP
jgi:hypothetical protein